MSPRRAQRDRSSTAVRREVTPKQATLLLSVFPFNLEICLVCTFTMEEECISNLSLFFLPFPQKQCKNCPAHCPPSRPLSLTRTNPQLLFATEQEQITAKHQRDVRVPPAEHCLPTGKLCKACTGSDRQHVRTAKRSGYADGHRSDGG